MNCARCNSSCYLDSARTVRCPDCREAVDATLGVGQVVIEGEGELDIAKMSDEALLAAYVERERFAEANGESWADGFVRVQFKKAVLARMAVPVDSDDLSPPGLPIVGHARPGAEQELRRAAFEKQSVVAYIRDRAEQYKTDSGSRVALEELASLIAEDEHVAAFRHGELDDLLSEERKHK